MNNKKDYNPPYTITSDILRLVADISEAIGRYSVIAETSLTPHLRRDNRIKTVQASLEIENNSLTVDQVSPVLDGKRVLGHPREIQEVKNAFAAYDHLPKWNMGSVKDLLAAHKVLMSGLVEEAGVFRSSGVGIYRGEHLVHMTPPADRVSHLIYELLHWLVQTNEHPLIEVVK